MKTRSTRSDQAEQGERAAGAARSPAQRQATAPSRYQQMASDSPQAAQLMAQAQLMAGGRPVQRVEEEEPLQGKFTTPVAAPRQRLPAAASSKVGLPQQLKTGIESLSGVSMNHVKVHYNSSQPAKVNAHAYAQGSDIYMGPGQERHLPHEAWHVVQQAKGRVQPTMQLQSGISVNDDHSLEAEADAMGEKAMQWQGGGAVRQLSATVGAPVVQMVKYVWRQGKVRQVEDNYAKKKTERWSTEEQFLSRNAEVEDNLQVNEIRLRLEREQAIAARERAVAERKQARAARRARVTPGQLPAAHVGKQMKYPGVVKQADGLPADLVYRGMSVNNIRNLQKDKPAVFTAQAPTGTANAVQHIVDDSPASPYLSFEADELAVSAGKFATKPVTADNKPIGVTRNADGFLKQEKSYTAESRESYPDAKRIGYVGGIPADAGAARLDVSTPDKAELELSASALGSAKRRKKAKELAVADKEVLVKPGEHGIARAKVPFIAKVKEVGEAYYRKHVARQTSHKALGYYKPYGTPAVYSKIQLPADNDQYKFNIPEDLRRTDEDSEDEMSDIESMDLGDYDSDVD